MSKLTTWAVRWFAGGIVRDIAEGKKGERAKAIYWWLAGKKTLSAAILAILFGALYAFQPDAAERLAQPAATVIGMLVAWGLIDKTWRNADPPKWVGDALQHLISFGAGLAVLFALVVNGLHWWGCASCPVYEEHARLAADAVAAAATWLAAWLNDPPEKRADIFGRLFKD